MRIAPASQTREVTDEAAAGGRLDAFVAIINAALARESELGRGTLRLNALWGKGDGPNPAQLKALVGMLERAGYDVSATPQMIGVIPGAPNGVTIIDVGW